MDPGDVPELLREGGPVEVDAVAVGVDDEGKRGEEDEPDDGLAGFQWAGLRRELVRGIGPAMNLEL